VAVTLWGGAVAERVKFLNQGGRVWVFRLAKQACLGNSGQAAEKSLAACLFFWKRNHERAAISDY
jgi:hypothetical protein